MKFVPVSSVLNRRLDLEPGGWNWSIPCWIAAVLLAIMTLTCGADPFAGQPAGSDPVEEIDDLLVVDCKLPGKIMRIGQKARFVGPPRPVKTTADDCGIRGGQYVAYDRANYKTARKVWLSKARSGDPEAQNYLGEIYEKGLGVEPDYLKARQWYQRAADQGHAPAQINLGQLYESGLGVAKDSAMALEWYRRASGLSVLQPVVDLQPAIAPAETEGPTIDIIEPVAPMTRGVSVVYAERPAGERLIIGRVRPAAGLSALTVNGSPTPFEDNGIFQSRVSVGEAGAEATIVAVDTQGRQGQRILVFRSRDPVPSRAEFGNYHALVIGNNAYRFLPPLRTAIGDAQTVSELLQERYGFKTTTLYDASRYGILSALNTLRETLTEQDNLLIYYAGHGQLDETNDRGYWLPIDAEPESTANWISNVALTDILNIMSVGHVLVVADSCYSGTLTRSVLTQLRPGQSEEERRDYYRAVLSKRSRTALTSGANSPVLDSGPAGHSVFANALIEVLRSSEGVLEGQRLYLEIVARVTRSAAERRFEQIPQYAPIKFAGHEAGDFFLVAISSGDGTSSNRATVSSGFVADRRIPSLQFVEGRR